MKLSDTLAPERVKLDLSSTDKEGAIKEVLDLLNQSVALSDPAAVLKRIMYEESIMSTGVGSGLGIPHARSDQVEGVVAALGISRAGIEYGSADGEPVHLVFLILSSVSAMPAYMSVLSRTSRIFDDEEMRNRVISAGSEQEIIDLIRSQEPV
jgi:mannitol/fructose-specific phosphotransferase system IIA component (Ntr-type)